VWIGSVGKIYVMDAIKRTTKVSWLIKEEQNKNVNCLLYLSSVDEVWSCGDSESLNVWRGNIWMGKRSVARLDGHEVGSRILTLGMSLDQSLLFSGGTDRIVLVWNVKAKVIVQRIVVSGTVEVNNLSVLWEKVGKSGNCRVREREGESKEGMKNGSGGERRVRPLTLLCSTKEGYVHSFYAQVLFLSFILLLSSTFSSSLL
jgi:WD40 repeat protein